MGIRPVQRVAHLYGDQDGQGHCHGGGRLEHLAADVGEVLVVLAALHEVGLTQEGGQKRGLTL